VAVVLSQLAERSHTATLQATTVFPEENYLRDPTVCLKLVWRHLKMFTTDEVECNGFSLRRPKFSFGPVHVIIVMLKVAVKQMFLWVLGFFPTSHWSTNSPNASVVVITNWYRPIWFPSTKGLSLTAPRNIIRRWNMVAHVRPLTNYVEQSHYWEALVSQLVKKFSAFMKPEFQLPYSQMSATGPYPGRAEPTPRSLWSFRILSPIYV
jgi:hypothetical protein